MPRTYQDKDGSRRNTGRNPFAAAQDPDGVGADTERIANWDTRPEEVVRVILGFLQRGQAIMFGISRDGGVVSVAVNYGEKQWARKYAHDEQELIGVIHQLAVFLREEEAKETQAKLDRT
jgi:hypothetical protein